MPHSIFVSDLHLAPERPHINEVFFDLAGGAASRAASLYVLGDLFEYWVGDDDLDDPFNAAVAKSLEGLAARGVAVYFMHGNRDFLIGKKFAERSGARLLADPTPLVLHGVRTLLMHGDTLCTDDVEYQKFRAYARDPKFQAEFLAQPITARKERVGELRAINEQAKQAKAAEIMDVAPAAVEAALREHGYPRLIHGHTHRPARHVHVVDGHECERWVLNDWYERGGYLRCDAGGCTAVWL
ncbi:MAG: UDP-2,3-diacylglucosamine diphosphatase [Betaproteobacteria bacterium]|nr:UDP-2,3-diacylglucosamine diphosphatase [Betaproteobacteria bacterium]